MNDFIKVLFFIVAGIFFISYVQDAGLGGEGGLFGNSSSSGGSYSTASYTRSYDTNDDGFVSDWEYRQGEKERIEDELRSLQRELARTLANTRESAYADLASLSKGDADERNPDREYVIVNADYANDSSVTVTGWTLKSLASGSSVAIGKGIPPAREGFSSANEYTIQLGPSKKLFVITGEPRSRDKFKEDTFAQVDDEWVAVLRHNKELWDNDHDVILLLDAGGLIIDYVSY